MAFIETTEPAAAQGELRQEYEQAVLRSGRVWNILRVMSPNPEVLRASMSALRADHARSVAAFAGTA